MRVILCDVVPTTISSPALHFIFNETETETETQVLTLTLPLCALLLFDSSQLKSGGMFMLVTAISYVIIQGPAFVFNKSSERVAASGEHLFALLGLVSCLFFFCAYLVSI